MKQFYTFPFLILSLLIGTPALSSDFEEGERAYMAGDFITAFQKWRILAEQGDLQAQNNVGTMYDQGKGVEQDYIKAFNWYYLAAEQGHKSSQFNIGVMYLEGKGVEQNYIFAHKWLNISATLGDEDAINGRDHVGKYMSPEQVSEAQRLASEWVEKHQ